MKIFLRNLLILLAFLGFNNAIAQTCTTPTGGTINGPSQGCSNKVGSYTITGVSNATSYNWTITGTNDFTKISDTEYSLIYGSSNVTITVTPVNSAGPCSGTPIVRTIQVGSSPSNPIITQTGTMLSSSLAATYQWYRNGVLITGATSRTYSPTINGLYRVEVKNSSVDMCNSFSDPFNFTVTSIKEDQKFREFTFYPNPISSTINTIFNYKYDLLFLDLSGKEVFRSLNLKGEVSTELSTLQKGIYIMRINSEGKTTTRKIIVN